MMATELATPGVRSGARDKFGLVARVLLGAVFVLLAWKKIENPVGFLKAVREYHLVPDDRPTVLNAIAALLPWAELTWGLLLLAGIFVRGAALVAGVSLVAFTAAIASRGMDLHSTLGGSFCAVAFDCGCGTGVENVCTKLWQNVGLISLSIWLVVVETRFLCLRPRLSR